MRFSEESKTLINKLCNSPDPLPPILNQGHGRFGFWFLWFLQVNLSRVWSKRGALPTGKESWQLPATHRCLICGSRQRMTFGWTEAHFCMLL